MRLGDGSSAGAAQSDYQLCLGKRNSAEQTIDRCLATLPFRSNGNLASPMVGSAAERSPCAAVMPCPDPALVDRGWTVSRLCGRMWGRPSIGAGRHGGGRRSNAVGPTEFFRRSFSHTGMDGLPRSPKFATPEPRKQADRPTTGQSSKNGTHCRPRNQSGLSLIYRWHLLRFSEDQSPSGLCLAACIPSSVSRSLYAVDDSG